MNPQGLIIKDWIIKWCNYHLILQWCANTCWDLLHKGQWLLKPTFCLLQKSSTTSITAFDGNSRRQKLSSSIGCCCLKDAYRHHCLFNVTSISTSKLFRIWTAEMQRYMLPLHSLNKVQSSLPFYCLQAMFCFHRQSSLQWCLALRVHMCWGACRCI